VAPSGGQLCFGFALTSANCVTGITAAVQYFNDNTQSVTTSSASTVTFTGTNNKTIACQCVAAPAGLVAGDQFKLIFTFTTTAGCNFFFDDFISNATASSAIPLPVSFTALAARKLNSGTQISWSVGAEQGVSSYEIEKSTNGQSYAKVGSVKAAAQTVYSFVDAQIAKGTVYYRVKSVDANGSFKYSSVVRYDNGKMSMVLKAFPMPARKQLTVQHSATNNGIMTLTSEDGRLIKSIKPTPGSLETPIDLSGLKAGLYLLRFDDGNGVIETLKVVKQ
jgi:hypothetical protein